MVQQISLNYQLGVFMFKVAGVSRFNGVVKVRFANDMTRVKMLTKAGNTDIELMELPESMDKSAVVAFLKTTELYLNSEYKDAIDAADSRYNEAQTVKVTTKPSKAKVKADKVIEADVA